jgi:hypothetical protein
MDLLPAVAVLNLLNELSKQQPLLVKLAGLDSYFLFIF